MEKIVSLAKRRGFIFPSSEIYGGFSSGYDYGPLGVEMKNNIRDIWWKDMVQTQENIVGLDSAILMPPEVLEASGHLSAGFADRLRECKECHQRFKADELKKSRCPQCGGKLTKPKKFNLMMKTFVGPIETEADTVYLRPETTQGIYVNFRNVMNSMRLKIPFGIAQVGKAFRNEVNPRNFIYRMREFEQMEMEWFCSPLQTKKYFKHWKKKRMRWYLKLGISEKNLRAKKIPQSELPHYAIQGVDLEYKFPFGWGELEAIHNRGDWDLSTHSKHSSKELKYLDKQTKEEYIPQVIETSGGLDRSFLAFLCEAYQEVKGGRTKTTESAKEKEILLKLDPRIAPIKVAVLPLVKNKPSLVKKARQVFESLIPHFKCQYDEGGSIGRRYRRMDEIGVPFALTIDFESLKQNDLTIRDRDTMKQIRAEISNLPSILREALLGKKLSKIEKERD